MRKRAMVGAVLGVSMLLASSPAEASAPIVYKGSMLQARALAQLQGARPSNVRVRSAGGWKSSFGEHYRINVVRFNPVRVDASHYQRSSFVVLELFAGGHLRATAYVDPRVGNDSYFMCASSMQEVITPSSVSSSTGAVNVAISFANLEKCGLRHGTKIAVTVFSGLGVQRFPDYATWSQTVPNAIVGVL